jgi:hypothetical protein
LLRVDASGRNQFLGRFGYLFCRGALQSFSAESLDDVAKDFVGVGKDSWILPFI